MGEYVYHKLSCSKFYNEVSNPTSQWIDDFATNLKVKVRDVILKLFIEITDSFFETENPSCDMVSTVHQSTAISFVHLPIIRC